jgi:hypothetical protein
MKALLVLMVLGLAVVPAAACDDRYPSSCGHAAKSRGKRTTVPAVPFGGSSLASIAARYEGATGRVVGMSARWCGAFMRKVVREAGLPDLPSGNLSQAWRRYGRDAGGPVVGAIAIKAGHVGVVAGTCPDGRVKLFSPRVFSAYRLP